MNDGRACASNDGITTQRLALPYRSKNAKPAADPSVVKGRRRVLHPFLCATVQTMWPFRRRKDEEKKGNRLIKRLVVGLIIGGAIGSIVGSKVLDKHRREHGVEKDDER